MNLKVEEWDLSYRNRDNFVFYPHEEIIRFAAKYIAKRIGLNEVNIKTDGKVLDLGCGIGRHVIFFEKLGIDAYGIDLSKEAIEIASNWLEKENINPGDKLFHGSAENLPWSQNEFDFIVSHGVLGSMPLDIARNIVKECHRVIKSEGLFYCDLIGDDTKHGINFEEEIVIETKHEKGTIQSYFTLGKIQHLIKDLFEIKEINKIITQDVITQNYYSRYHLILKKIEGDNE